MKTQFLIEESDVIYNEKRSKFLTSSWLKAAQNNLKLYKRLKEGRVKAKKKDYFDFGTAFHVRMEGQVKFLNEYHHCNLPRKNTKAYKELEDEFEGMKLISTECHEQIEDMVISVKEHPVAKNLIKDALFERVIRTKYLGMPSQIKIDCLTPGIIVDIKTTAKISGFDWSIRKFGYGESLAFYHEVFRAARPDEIPPDLYLVVVEKEEPYTCGVWQLEGGDLKDFIYTNELTIEKIKNAEKTHEWTTGFEEVRQIYSQDYAAYPQ